MPALVLYDVTMRRTPVRVSWVWVRPYVPFVVMTIGYLMLRYVLFGEVARESALTSAGLRLFLENLSTHMRRMTIGEADLRVRGAIAAIVIGIGVCAVAMMVSAVRAGRADRSGARAIFLVGWLALGVAPTLVAGYASPRHMYLASIAWACAVAMAIDLIRHGQPTRVAQAISIVVLPLIVGGYGYLLWRDVENWGVRADVSHRAVVEIEREAMRAPAGTLIAVDVPVKSWNFALPHAIRPPFTQTDVTERASVISPSTLYCCAASQWEAYTREALRVWLANSDHPPFIAIQWRPETNSLTKLSSADPSFRSLVTLLAQTSDRPALDRAVRDLVSAAADTQRAQPQGN